MRLSLLVNCADPTFCHDYTVVWLDTGQRVWVRQAGAGIDLPDEGRLRIEADVIALHAHNDHDIALVTLRGLTGDPRGDPRRRAWPTQGSAAWISQTRHMPIDGTWRLQAVEDRDAAADASRAPHLSPPTRTPPAQPHHAWYRPVLLKDTGR